MSKIVADSLASRGGGSISVVNNVNVTGDVNATGIVTATSFSGNGSGLTGLNIPSSSDWRDNSLF
jgi:hypothetical protein